MPHSSLRCSSLHFTALHCASGLVEQDVEGALRGFAEVVKMEGDKGEW